jgi:hypothetical protein
VGARSVIVECIGDLCLERAEELQGIFGKKMLNCAVAPRDNAGKPTRPTSGHLKVSLLFVVREVPPHVG